jgi:hypothetical protein
MTSTSDRDDWSTPISEDESAEQPDSPVDEGGRPSVAEKTPPESGLGAPAGKVDTAATTEVGPDSRGHDSPPVDDEREHPADFAQGSYDDRQEDAEPGARRDTPAEADREA